MDKKLAVIFPGVGYHADKPLLYYSGKIAKEREYEVIKLVFRDLPDRIFESEEKRAEAFGIAMKQAEEALKDVDFDSFREVLFISKSIGTGIAAAYQAKCGMKARNIYYTPLLATLKMMQPESGVVFHGTNDPWEENTEAVREMCGRLKLPLHIIKDGNHSLETGCTAGDLPVLMAVMAETERFIDGC
ncbi:MAG: hypothetical protein BACD_00113 [Bacteroides rodentium]